MAYSFTRDGQTSGPYNDQFVPPGPSVDQPFNFNLSDLEEGGEYDMHVWVINSEGTKNTG